MTQVANEEVCPSKPRTRRKHLAALTFAGLLAGGSILMMTERISAEKRPAGVSSRLRALDPDVGVAYARTQVVVTFPNYLFEGEDFPVADLKRPSRLELELGPCVLKPTFYNEHGQPVEKAMRPGPYAAIVEIIPKRGASSRRYFRLYRVASPLPADGVIDPKRWDDLSAALGVSASSLARESPSTWDRFRSTLSELRLDPGFARVISGVYLNENETQPVRAWNDAMAADRRWWVDWKLAQTPQNRFVYPFFGPKRMETPPAPELREGPFSETGMKPGSVETLDALFKEWASNSDQGFAVCIARRGVIVLHRAYGMRDGKPMTVNTKSWMASVTKPMSGALMMMLVDDGRLTLDDRVADILPPLHRLTSKRPITVRHLYTHTHGLEWWMKAQDEWPDLDERVADVYHFARTGRNFNYNGTGYALAGKVIEAVSQKSLPDFYHEHLLAPLGMDSTDVAGSYGDARSIPLDIARFGQMLLNGGTYGKKRFFRAQAYHAMLPRPLTSVLGPGATKVWGIGLNGTPREFGHGAASSATFRIDREQELVVVITRNSAGKKFLEYEARFWETLRALL